MGITLGGIMRGGLPVLSERLRKNEDIKEAAILKVGERFAALKDKVAEAEEKNRTYMSNVESVAKSLAMDKDVVYNIFKVYGGNNKSSMTHLKNLAKAYVAKGKPIPTMAVMQTQKMMPPKEDKAILAGMPTDDKKEESIFDKAMSLFQTASPDEIFQEFMKRNPQLNETQVRQIMKNTVTPEYSPKSTIDPKAFVATLDAPDKDTKEEFGQYTYLTQGVDDLLKATRTNPQEFGDNVKAVALLPKQLAVAQQLYKDGKTTEANVIFENIADALSTIYPTAVPGKADEAEKKFNALVDEVMRNHPGLDRETVVRKLRIAQSKKLTVVDGQPAVIDQVWDNDKQEFVAYPRVLNEYSYNGVKGLPRPKIISDNNKKLKINASSISRVGGIIQNISKYKLGYVSFIADTVKGVSTGTDIFNAIFDTNVNILSESLNPSAFQKMRQDGIGLIAAAKDQLFNDPRLSDRDLKIVLDYVGVIQSNIGSTQAIAAMYGLQTALLKDSALRMAQNNPGLAINGPTDDAEQANIVKILGRDGAVVNRNESISSRLLHDNADSMGIKLLSKQQAQKLAQEKPEEYEAYKGKLSMLVGQVSEAIKDLRIYRTLTADEQRAYAATTDTTSSSDPRIVIASDPAIMKRFASTLPKVPTRT